MPYVFTTLGSWVFDQVLTYTGINRLKDNQEEIKDSFSEEHTFADGVHKRITKYSNLLMNPTARRGNAFWFGNVTLAHWDTGDPFPSYGVAPNFTYAHWTDTSAFGPRWDIVPAASFAVDFSEKIEIGGNVDVVLSVETYLFNLTVAGTANIDIACYDSSDQLLAGAGVIDGVAQIAVNASETGFTLHEATGTTHANTAYIIVRKWINTTLQASGFRVRKIKLEKGTVATTYSDESSMPQYLSARYTRTSNQNFAAAGGIIDYDIKATKGFDDPGTDRVTTGAAWKFTADRYMKVRVSTGLYIWPLSGTWTTGDNNRLDLRLNGSLYAVLDYQNLLADYNGGTQAIFMQGSTLIELDKGDYIDCFLTENSVTTVRTLSAGDGTGTYIDIEEI